MKDALLKEVVASSGETIGRTWLEARIRKKLLEQGRDADGELVSALVQHVLGGNEGAFKWPGESANQSIALTFDAEDFAILHRQTEKFIRIFPTLVTKEVDRSAKQLLKVLRGKWAGEHALQSAESSRFRSNLDVRWGDALGWLRMILTISREHGAEAAARLQKSRAKSGRVVRGVLILLHARACQVTGEIIALLENGYADGAMGRWRTLYEIGVVAQILSDGGDDLAQRYLDHRAVEAKKALDEFDRCHAQLGYAPIGRRERAKILAEYGRVVAKYETAFSTPYGWAAKHLGNKNPSFTVLQRAANSSAMGSYFRMASHNVHAGPHGVLHRLGLLTSERNILAGASNAGLDAAGENAARTLTLITLLVLPRRLTTLDQIAAKALVQAATSASTAFIRADRQLRRDAAAPLLVV